MRIGIVSNLIAVIIKSAVSNKVEGELSKKLIETLVDDASGESLNKINNFINSSKSKISHVLSEENLKSMNISEDHIGYVVAEIKGLLSRINITDEILRKCNYNVANLERYLSDEYCKNNKHIEYESDIKTVLYSVAEVLIDIESESDVFVNKVMIQISNTGDDTNAEVHRISEYLQENFEGLDAKNQNILAILLMILEQIQKNDKKNIDKKQKIKSRTKEYADKWDENMFLNNFSEWDENPGVNVKLKDVYIDKHLPHFIWENNKKESDNLDKLLSKYIEQKNDNKMLLILGQPGIGKSTLITWITANFEDRINDILVYKFASDFEKINWEDTRISNRILEKIGLSSNDLNGKILILDGFDEVCIEVNRRRDILDSLYGDWIYSKNIDNFSLIVTCRENYIQRFAILKCKYITLQPWDEIQIKSFCDVFKKKTGTNLSDDTKEKLLENKEILGIPLILYMTLALNISIEKEGSIVDIYDKIFSVEGGIYDRCIDNINFAEKHRIGEKEIKEDIHQISREIALWMFDNNPDKASIPRKEYKNICKEIKKKGGYEKIEQDFKIGNYFKVVKHCEGTDTEELYFVHRSIYEYFVAEYICVLMQDAIETLDGEKTPEKRLAGVLGSLLKGNRLSIKILEFLKAKIRKCKLNEAFDKVNGAFQLMLQDGMIYYTGQCYKNIINCEMMIFSNMLEIIHLWDKDYYEFSNYIRKYLYYSGNYNLNLKKTSVIIKKDFCEFEELKNMDTGAICLRKAKLSGTNLSSENLRRADLRGSDLRGTDLVGADLTEADLTGADLRKAKLMRINLTGANLTGANLTGANLTGANLTGANLIGADLRKANLIGADLTGADLRKAILIGANLGEVKLEVARLLETIFDEKQIPYLRDKYDLQKSRVFIDKTNEIISYKEFIALTSNCSL